MMICKECSRRWGQVPAVANVNWWACTSTNMMLQCQRSQCPTSTISNRRRRWPLMRRCTTRKWSKSICHDLAIVSYLNNWDISHWWWDQQGEIWQSGYRGKIMALLRTSPLRKIILDRDGEFCNSHDDTILNGELVPTTGHKPIGIRWYPILRGRIALLYCLESFVRVDVSEMRINHRNEPRDVLIVMVLGLDGEGGLARNEGFFISIAIWCFDM